MVVSYVDDLKLDGPMVTMADGWTLTPVGLDMYAPSPIDVFLGCQHEVQDAVSAGPPHFIPDSETGVDPDM